MACTYHDGRCAVRQWTVNHVSVSGDPSNVGGTPINITRMIIENVLESGGRVNQVSRSGVENALRFAGGTATCTTQKGEKKENTDRFQQGNYHMAVILNRLVLPNRRGRLTAK